MLCFSCPGEPFRTRQKLPCGVTGPFSRTCKPVTSSALLYGINAVKKEHFIAASSCDPPPCDSRSTKQVSVACETAFLVPDLRLPDSEVTLQRRWSHLHSLAVSYLGLVPEHNFLLSLGNDGVCRVLDYLQVACRCAEQRSLVQLAILPQVCRTAASFGSTVRRTEGVTGILYKPAMLCRRTALFPTEFPTSSCCRARGPGSDGSK